MVLAADLPPNTLKRWDQFNGLGREYYATRFRPLLGPGANPA